MTKMNNNMWTIEIYYPEISDVKIDWSLPLCLNYVCPGWHNYSGLDVDPWNYWIKQSYRTSIKIFKNYKTTAVESILQSITSSYLQGCAEFGPKWLLILFFSYWRIFSLIHKHNLYSWKLEQVCKGTYQNSEITGRTGLFENTILVVSVSKFSLQLTTAEHTINRLIWLQLIVRLIKEFFLQLDGLASSS